MSQTQQTGEVLQTPPPGESDSAPLSFWFLGACIVLPVIWGVVVHRVFSHLRKGRKLESDESSWPDYQI